MLAKNLSFKSLITVLINLTVSTVSGTEWCILYPCNDDSVAAECSINADGSGPSNEEFSIQVMVNGQNKYEENCSVGPDDYWSQICQHGQGGWTNSVIPLPGTLTIYEGHHFFSTSLDSVDLEFAAGGGPA